MDCGTIYFTAGAGAMALLLVLVSIVMLCLGMYDTPLILKVNRDTNAD